MVTATQSIQPTRPEDRSLLKQVAACYRRRTIRDRSEILLGMLRERLLGVDTRIFDRTIAYYAEVKGQVFTPDQALARAHDKKRHKNAWEAGSRSSLEEIWSFYQTVDVYPFRQPYNHRFGGYRWLRKLVSHVPTPRILEYGCGSAVVSEWLIDNCPGCSHAVADIPSTTLDFVKWKKKRYDLPYEVLTIGPGASDIPLSGNFDLIICKDVLEHTPNPLEIVQRFFAHLAPGGVLYLDFLLAPGGENLEVAAQQRDDVIDFLGGNLHAAKVIDVPAGDNKGVYVKPLG